MAQFTLAWDNTSLLSNTNATGQRASYRQKKVGGLFQVNGFTPTNDLPKTATTSDSPILLDNIVYEFKVEALCSAGGPTANDNGIIEQLVFVCITPTKSATHNSATIEVNVVDTDIVKVEFSLKRSSDNSVVSTATVNVISGLATRTVNGLTPITSYYWEYKLIANVANVETASTVCGPHLFTTIPDPVCNPVVSLSIHSVEIIL